MLLNASTLTIDVKLIMKCCNKKIIRKSAESAMANFLPIEEFKIPLIVEVYVLLQQRYTTLKF